MTNLQHEPTSPPQAYVRAAPSLPPLPLLSGEVRCDVVVIGGGLTGGSLALHLAEQGAKVVVLEAKEIGWGGSGRAFGQVVPYTKHSEGLVLDHFGAERGQRLIDATGAAPGLVYDLIEKHAIECEAAKTGLLFTAHSQKGLRGLEKRAAYWESRGAPASVIGPAETARMMGTNFYQYALFDKRGGTLNPYAYTRGLAQAAINAGADVYVGSPMQSSSKEGTRWRISTDNGSVLADKVVFATDSYSGSAVPELQRGLIMLRAYQLVTKPLPASVLETILPGRQSMTDTRRLFSGIRVHPSGRVHMSVDGPAFNVSGRAFSEAATARMHKLFPQVGEFEWDEMWRGWVGVTVNEYPRLLDMKDGRFGAFGYSGRGIALGTLLGRELARHIVGNHPDDLVLPLTAPEPIAWRGVARPLVSSLMTLYRILDARDERGVTKVKA